MKKNVLTLSITAALVGFGFAGGAQAVGLASGVLPITSSATSLVESTNGIGQLLYVPYFSVQNGNTTMINLVNTDTTNGKAVKVRFRGAGNSDDLFDFQVFLSPGDVWTANVSKRADGHAIMTTTDTSCTKPAKSTVVGDRKINDQAFNTARMNDFRSGDALANETREGYVEIFNMADMPPASGAYIATKHPSRNTAPPCSGPAWTNLDTDSKVLDSTGLTAPTTGLMANWIILNATDAGAWSGAAAAIVASTNPATPTPVAGNMVYFPQTTESLGAASANIANFTSDPWLIAKPSYAMAYDLPDFSIPYTSLSTPGQQVAQLNRVLATSKIINEFLTASSIQATTDWVLSMPTRRYAVAYDYFSTATDKRVYTVATGDAYFTSGNTSVIDKQICVGAAAGQPSALTSVSYDQDEYTPLDPGSSVIISPVLPGQAASFLICGETSVLAFNSGESASSTGLITSSSKALGASVARSSIENGFNAGWTALMTPGAPSAAAAGATAAVTGAAGLPIIGYSAYRAVGAVTTQGTSAKFGATLPHRTARVNP